MALIGPRLSENDTFLFDPFPVRLICESNIVHIIGQVAKAG